MQMPCPKAKVYNIHCITPLVHLEGSTYTDHFVSRHCIVMLIVCLDKPYQVISFQV